MAEGAKYQLTVSFFHTIQILSSSEKGYMDIVHNDNKSKKL